ncbi:serine O-acetyltransferase [Vibrio cyclitrophicus]|uniref:serine O-acetyltransferase n=1 Tax=Vibrio cyclitrophicus TaxID=47951 RepID=UPI000CB3E7B3|nr:serine acetyltransferase [Vibrio cyclitrophicus]PMG35128.1 hypothetical protein BCU92_21430 [Vibrio cyclitrophicus]
MFKKILRWALFGEPIETLYYRALKNYNRGNFYKFVSIVCLKKINRNYACYLSGKAIIGRYISFPHPVGIVIGDGVIIADRVTIYQNVTLGAARIGEGDKGLYPRIGNNVVIFAGAKLIGDISIGDGAVIGANAVVTKNVPANVSVVGIPSRIVGESVISQQN